MDLWATVIAVGGEGNELSVINHYPPDRPHVPIDSHQLCIDAICL